MSTAVLVTLIICVTVLLIIAVLCICAVLMNRKKEKRIDEGVKAFSEAFNKEWRDE